MEIQKVIQTIQDLCRKTVKNGCTEAEAMSAAHKIGQLMKVYNLSMDKVFLSESQCVTGVIVTGRKRKHPISGCLVGIAEFCDCRVWCNYGGGYSVFGLSTDVEMAKYLYGIVLDAMDTATAAYKRSTNYRNGLGVYGIPASRKTLSVSFQKGMASRIYQRLVEMTEQRHTEEVEECPLMESTGTSLILVKRDKVKDEFEKLGFRLKKAARTHSYCDNSAWKEGTEAGNRVNLNRPLPGNVTGYLE